MRDPLAFNPEADRTLWSGGPFFLPRLKLNREQANAMVEELIQWQIWTETHGRDRAYDQILNTLRSVNLMRVIDSSPPRNNDDPRAWMKVWMDAFGEERIRNFPNMQNALDHPSFEGSLD